MIARFLKKKVWALLDSITRALLRGNPEIQKIGQIDFIVNGTLRGSHVSLRAKVYKPFRVADSTIGDYTYLAEGAMLSQVSIGKFCSIGPHVLAGYGIHPTNGISSSPMFYSTLRQNGISLSSEDKIAERKPIVVGNDVFIGANVTILDGVNIGDGAVIGAGAVVSKDIPPYAIAVGCPIKIIRYRFDEATIDQLLKIKWWDWPLEKLVKVEQNFFNVHQFINLESAQNE